MLVPYTNAAAYIGHVNPGVGYWWTQTNGAWCLSVPAPVAVSVFWPAFVLSLVIFAVLAWLLSRCLKARQT